MIVAYKMLFFLFKEHHNYNSQTLFTLYDINHLQDVA